MTTPESRGDLGRFLRNRRERLRPADVGLPTGPRRRSRGLRREEVAVLAGLSPTWYKYLEQGRAIRPSPEVLDNLVRVLRLSEDERRYAHTLAYGYVVGPARLTGDREAVQLLRDVVAGADDSPYPMYAVDHLGDLVAWNCAATEWYDDWGRLPPSERNLIRWMLTSPRARVALPDWESDSRDLVARWRTEAARRPQDPDLRARVAEFVALSPRFDRWWQEQIVQEQRSRRRRLRHPRHGVRELLVVPLRFAELASADVFLHLPVDHRAPGPHHP